jgi:fructose-1,6-bisphosphatase/inositol monophosphatase family enzyme
MLKEELNSVFCEGGKRDHEQEHRHRESYCLDELAAEKEQSAAEEEGAALWTRSPAQRRTEGSALGGLRLQGQPRQTERGEWDDFQSTLRIEQTGSVAYKLALIAAGRGERPDQDRCRRRDSIGSTG